MSVAAGSGADRRDADGRVIVLTGVAEGIGRACALGFLADGAKVVGCDLPGADCRDVEMAGADVLRGDVSDPAFAPQLVEAAVSEHGRVDALLNNAGIAGSGTFTSMEVDVLARVVQVNLLGPLYLMHAVLPVMIGQGYGRIVNVVSRAAERLPPGLVTYGATKAGLYGLSRGVAKELTGTGVLVNCLIPGPIRTRMNTAGRLPPESVYETARHLATLPGNGPSGAAFWDMSIYPLFGRAEHNAQLEPIDRTGGAEDD